MDQAQIPWFSEITHTFVHYSREKDNKHMNKQLRYLENVGLPPFTLHSSGECRVLSGAHQHTFARLQPPCLKWHLVAETVSHCHSSLRAALSARADFCYLSHLHQCLRVLRKKNSLPVWTAKLDDGTDKDCFVLQPRTQALVLI